MLRWEEEEEEASGTCVPSCVQSQVRLSLFNPSQSLPQTFSIPSVLLHHRKQASPLRATVVPFRRTPQARETFVTKLQKRTVKNWKEQDDELQNNNQSLVLMMKDLLEFLTAQF